MVRRAKNGNGNRTSDPTSNEERRNIVREMVYTLRLEDAWVLIIDSVAVVSLVFLLSFVSVVDYLHEHRNCLRKRFRRYSHQLLNPCWRVTAALLGAPWPGWCEGDPFRRAQGVTPRALDAAGARENPIRAGYSWKNSFVALVSSSSNFNREKGRRPEWHQSSKP